LAEHATGQDHLICRPSVDGVEERNGMGQSSFVHRKRLSQRSQRRTSMADSRET